MAAIALAIRLYESDFGHRPATLDELVPTYLPTLPVDPMAADGRTFGYKPEGVDPFLPWKADDGSELRLNRRVPILYSVGDNAVDDDGEFTLDDDGGAEAYGEEARDMVFLLDRRVTLPGLPQSDNNTLRGDDDTNHKSPDETGVDDPEPEDRAGDEP
jgi:hypothetical protein